MTALPWLLGGLGAAMALTAMRRPLGFLLRMAGRMGLGVGFLTLFAPIGKLLGAGLGVNLFNALVMGTLGVPGFGLLMLLDWALR